MPLLPPRLRTISYKHKTRANLPHKQYRAIPLPITVPSCKQPTNSKPKPILCSREYANPISPFHQRPTQSTNLCQPVRELPNGSKSKSKQKLRSSSRRIAQRRTNRRVKNFAEGSMLPPTTHPIVKNHLKTTEAKCLANFFDAAWSWVA